MSKVAPTKTDDQFVRSYADRLILEKLSEMEYAVKLSELADKLSPDGIGLSTVRSLLASNPDMFAYNERRWVPAARLESIGRPLNEALNMIVQRFGAPVPVSLLVQEMARVKNSDYDTMEPIVRRIIERDPGFCVTSNDEAALADWSFVADDEPLQRGLQVNKITEDDLSELQKKLGDFDWRADGAVAKALGKLAPVSLKALGAVAWRALNIPEDPKSPLLFDTRQFLVDALETDGFVLGTDGVMYPQAETKKWVSGAVKLAEKIAPTIELEDAAPIEIKTEDSQSIISKVASNEGTSTATKLLEDTYEITPGTKTFPDDLENMKDVLRADESVMWVGGDRFRKAGNMPDFITSMPEPFNFVQTDLRDDEGELIDVELTDEGLSSSLRKLLAHPLATDVMDEDILPAPKTMPESLRLVLKSIHRELGTFPLSQIPTDWFDSEPNLQELVFIDPNGRELQVWLNHETRLLYNLIDWWYEQPVESGSVFTVTKTGKPNVFEFEWLEQPDPVVYISTQRMEELREINMNSEGKSTMDLLIEVMGHWPKGADYLTILAEINVVRRSTRRLVASLLSSYQCFYQRSGSPVWHFDAKKVEQGFDKTKRKFVKK